MPIFLKDLLDARYRLGNHLKLEVTKHVTGIRYILAFDAQNVEQKEILVGNIMDPGEDRDTEQEFSLSEVDNVSVGTINRD